MSGRRAKNPSPLAGEDASRSEAGEGHGALSARGPSPGHSLRSRPASPARGEGKLEDGHGALSARGPSPGHSLRSRPASPARGEGGSADLTMRRRARAMRRSMTDAERKLWFALRDRRFAGFKFRRQVPLGYFIADFVCFEERLVIEVDGGQHADSLWDKRRDRWFAANRFRVMRFWNNEVLSNIEGVMTLLAEALHAEQGS